SRSRHTRSKRDWSSDVCSSDLDYLCLGCTCLFQSGLIGEKRGTRDFCSTINACFFAFLPLCCFRWCCMQVWPSRCLPYSFCLVFKLNLGVTFSSLPLL